MMLAGIGAHLWQHLKKGAEGALGIELLQEQESSLIQELRCKAYFEFKAWC